MGRRSSISAGVHLYLLKTNKEPKKTFYRVGTSSDEQIYMTSSQILSALTALHVRVYLLVLALTSESESFMDPRSSAIPGKGELWGATGIFQSR